ncbi:MAG TPA: dihydroneopterin aldolase [candidate division Zixibacteria bacterium]|nr:dihydroneopterin aldolase [candidate division Zixibacteria bacterium]
MKDIIRLGRMRFYGYHGVAAAERETGRVFEVDAELEVDLADAGRTDRLTDTIDYSKAYETIKDIVEGKAFSLLEALAQEIARSLLDSFDIYRVTLRVRKLAPPIAGNIEFIEVQITRSQADTAKLISDRREQEQDEGNG